MLLFAAVSRLSGASPDPLVLADVEAQLARAGRVERADHGPTALRWVALQPGADQGICETASTLLVAAGDIVYTGNEAEPSVADSTRAFCEAFDAKPQLALKRAQGSYAAAVLDKRSGALRVAADRLAVRPVYWTQQADHAVVSTCEWLLRSMTTLGHEPDWLAAAEQAGMGYPLADRTLDARVKRLESGMALHIHAGAVRVQAWWEPARLAPSTLQGRDLQQAVLDAFRQAVRRRLRRQRRVFAFLSGGMDSRLVVSALRECGAAVSTINFAPQGTQDLVLGRMMAARFGTEHFEFSPEDLPFSQRAAGAIEAYLRVHAGTGALPEEARTVWSGDGGSCGLGHVHLSPAVVRAARRGSGRAAAQALAAYNRQSLPRQMFRARHAGLADCVTQGIERDLASRPQAEPGRNCHLFIMLHDQRRNMARHFETIHESRLDYVLPFFDGDFLETVLAAPVDDFLDHALYNDLLLSLHDGSGEVPWQSYPGHVKCPVPVPPDLRDQWADGWLSDRVAARNRRQAHQVAISAALGPAFPAGVLRRSTMLVANLIAWLGLRDYGYWASALSPFMRAGELGHQRQG